MKNFKHVTGIIFLFSLLISLNVFSNDNFIKIGTLPKSDSKVTSTKIKKKFLPSITYDCSISKVNFFFLDQSSTYESISSKRNLEKLNVALKKGDIDIYYKIAKKENTLKMLTVKMISGIKNLFPSSQNNCASEKTTSVPIAIAPTYVSDRYSVKQSDDDDDDDDFDCYYASKQNHKQSEYQKRFSNGWDEGI